MIRVLHTSDWHLGLETCGHSRLAEQALFLEWLLDTCRDEAVDALVVAGDVYDVANPSVEAQGLFASFLVRLKAALPNCDIVVVAGNHDSGSRLELPRPFGVALGGIHLVGTLREDDPSLFERHVVPLRNASGAVAAWCLAVPFLRSSDLRCRVEEGETLEIAFARSVARLYASLRDHARSRDPALPVLALGHLTLSGSQRSGSERLLIGGVEAVPVAAVAEGVEHVALGHIHRRQELSHGSVSAVYPGSPLAMDVDERRYHHRVVLLEFDAAGDGVRRRDLEVPRRVPFLRWPEDPGTWEDVEACARAFDDTPWKDAPRDIHPLLDIRFTSDGPVPDLRERTQALLAGRHVRLAGNPRVVLSSSPDATTSGAEAPDLQRAEAPEDVLRRHWRSTYQTDLPEDLLGCFREIQTNVEREGISP